MKNEVFYVTAATVIPLLLIAVMATRSLRVGEYQQRPIIAALAFGLPVIGELAAFVFLFFEPIPNVAAVILAVMTWAGLLNQLALAAWWLAGLIKRDIAKIPVRHRADPADEDHQHGGDQKLSPLALDLNPVKEDEPRASQRSRHRLGTCIMCGSPLDEDASFCGQCGAVQKIPPETSQR
jgi:hypothetical protein